MRSPAEIFARWSDNFEIFFEAADREKKPLRQQRAILLTCIGFVGLELYRKLEAEIERTGTVKIEGSEPEKIHTCADILDAFANYYAPYRNTTQVGYTFFTSSQGSHDIDTFVQDLKEKAGDCGFTQ